MDFHWKWAFDIFSSKNLLFLHHHLCSPPKFVHQWLSHVLTEHGTWDVPQMPGWECHFPDFVSWSFSNLAWGQPWLPCPSLHPHHSAQLWSLTFFKSIKFSSHTLWLHFSSLVFFISRFSVYCIFVCVLVKFWFFLPFFLLNFIRWLYFAARLHSSA